MRSRHEKNEHVFTHQKSTLFYPPLSIERLFDVSVDQLFNAFKSERILKMWWWPQGFFADHVELDFRVGGRYFINMKGFDHGDGGMTGEFTEIIENARIVMSDRFADIHGRAITAREAKMPGVWPETIMITFEFERVDLTRTRFRLTQTGIPTELQKDCVQGWSQSFEKLENFLVVKKH